MIEAPERAFDAMAADYRHIIKAAASRPIPSLPPDLPPHFTNDYSDQARLITHEFGVSVDLF